jgi:hypothetical protein
MVIIQRKHFGRKNTLYTYIIDGRWRTCVYTWVCVFVEETNTASFNCISVKSSGSEFLQRFVIIPCHGRLVLYPRRRYGQEKHSARRIPRFPKLCASTMYTLRAKWEERKSARKRRSSFVDILIIFFFFFYYFLLPSSATISTPSGGCVCFSFLAHRSITRQYRPDAIYCNNLQSLHIYNTRAQEDRCSHL